MVIQEDQNEALLSLNYFENRISHLKNIAEESL